MTALLFAAYHGYIDMARYLLTKGILESSSLALLRLIPTLRRVLNNGKGQQRQHGPHLGRLQRPTRNGTLSFNFDAYFTLYDLIILSLFLSYILRRSNS